MDEKYSDKVIAAIDNFYQLKTKYEKDKSKNLEKYKKLYLKKSKDLKMFKRVTKGIKHKCVNCGRMVNTIFNVNNYSLSAKCGDLENPCNLNILINRSIYIPFDRIHDGDKIIRGLQQDIDLLKKNIIDLKTKFVLKIITDQEAISLFDKFNEKLSELLEELSLRKDIYLDLINNEFNMDVILEKEIKIKETISEIKNNFLKYKSDEKKDKRIINESLEKYVSVLIPTINELNEVKFRVREMENYDVREGAKIDYTKKRLEKHKYMYHNTEQVYFDVEDKALINNTYGNPKFKKDKKKQENVDEDEDFDYLI